MVPQPKQEDAQLKHCSKVENRPKKTIQLVYGAKWSSIEDFFSVRWPSFQSCGEKLGILGVI
jgi:hypothetical protein